MFWVEEILEDLIISVALRPEICALIVLLGAAAIYLGLRFHVLIGASLILTGIAITYAKTEAYRAACSRCNYKDLLFVYAEQRGYIFWETAFLIALLAIAGKRRFKNRLTTKER